MLRADLDAARRLCSRCDGAVRCGRERVGTDEEATGHGPRRPLPAAPTTTPSLIVVPRAGALTRAGAAWAGNPRRRVERRGARPPGRALARSTATPGPRGWPSPTTCGPTSQLRWLGQQRSPGIDVSVDDGTAARLPTGCSSPGPAGVRAVQLEDGRATFPPMRTDQLRMQVVQADAIDLGFDAQAAPSASGSASCGSSGLTYLPLGLSSDASRPPLRQRAHRAVNGTCVRHRRRCLGRGAAPGRPGAGRALPDRRSKCAPARTVRSPPGRTS